MGIKPEFSNDYQLEPDFKLVIRDILDAVSSKNSAEFEAMLAMKRKRSEKSFETKRVKCLITINVRMLYSPKIVALKVEENESIDKVKRMIEEQGKVFSQYQRLFWNGLELPDRTFLGDFGIQHESVLFYGPASQLLHWFIKKKSWK